MSHTNQSNTAPSAQPIEELRAELGALETRAEQIGAELQSARDAQNQAQSVFIEGHSDRAAMMEAGREVSALESVAHALTIRIDAKRTEVESAEVKELRALQIQEAGAHASRFLALQGEVESDAARLLALLESEGARITERIDAARDAARDFRLCCQSIENPPDAFETSNGQKISAAKIEGDGAPQILSWLYRRATENHAAREAFEALYRGARRDQETQWLRSFHDRSNATALNPDPAQIAANVAATREPPQPLNEEQQRQADARQWRMAVYQDTPENGGRARMEASHPGDTMQEAIDREAQELQAAAERRVRAELEGAFV